MKTKLTRAAAGLLCVCITAPGLARAAHAQDWSTYYTVTHPSEFKIDWKAFYQRAEALTASARKVLPHHLDLAYGDDPKQRLDVYVPERRPRGAPVFMFLHGGGFREGDRAQYGYVALPLAKHGIITVVSSYRLTPRFHYPDQPDDVRRALAWVFRNITSYGGNPNRIHVGGHSAGAILAASVSLKTDWLAGLSLPRGLIKGCVPISGGYDLTTLKSVWEYVPDPSSRAEASPMFKVEDPPPYSIVAVGSVEPYVDSSNALAERIRQRGARADVLVLEGLPHDGTVLALSDERSPLVQSIVTMIEATKTTDRPAR